MWPGEFLRVRIQVATRNDAVTIPPSAIQHGPEGLYAWVVKPDNTADQRSIETTTVNPDVAIVNKGVSTGERVVTEGQYRLETGSRVQASPAASTRSASAQP